MPEPLSFVMKRTPTMTRGTTPVFGQSLGESLRHAEGDPGEDPYRAICDELWRLLNRKRGYYGCTDNPLENALGVSEEGIEPWVYQLARIGEKCRRLRGMIGPERTLAIRETLADIAGHAVVAMAILDFEDDDL